MESVKDQRYAGLNVTSPLKELVLPYARKLTFRARQARAVNTIKFLKNGLCIGDNTDGIGFVSDLRLRCNYNLSAKRILIMGAGGAARGVISACLRASPTSIHVVNRTHSKADKLVAEFGSGLVSVKTLDDLKRLQVDLIVNATSAGLHNQLLEMPGILCRPQTLCYDLSYGKAAFPFLSWARTNNAGFYSDGLGMLIEQAAESFWIWTRKRPDTAAVYDQISPQVVQYGNKL
jgi:shikimate dehydrogenase